MPSYKMKFLVLGKNVDVSKHIFRLPSASGDRGPEVFMIYDY